MIDRHRGVLLAVAVTARGRRRQVRPSERAVLVVLGHQLEIRTEGQRAYRANLSKNAMRARSRRGPTTASVMCESGERIRIEAVATDDHSLAGALRSPSPHHFDDGIDLQAACFQQWLQRKFRMRSFRFFGVLKNL